MLLGFPQLGQQLVNAFAGARSDSATAFANEAFVTRSENLPVGSVQTPLLRRF
jgi:hypothetical protein